jgi:hypothetical protein
MKETMRLRTIALLLPDKTNAEKQFFSEFIALLSSIPNSVKSGRTVRFSPQYPHGSWPTTVIRCSQNDEIQLRFLHNAETEVELDDSPIRRSLRSAKRHSTPERGKHKVDIAHLNGIFHDKLVSLDHIGLNVPSTIVSKAEYQDFVASLGKTCTFHHYPTGEDWDFVLPSSRTEWKHGISEFRPGREPKWEFVYDEYTQVPVVQLCLETKLTKKALCKLLPDPYGVSYSGLPFRTVFINTPWRDFEIRYDMKAYSRNRENSWNTGAWLALRGKRLGY